MKNLPPATVIARIGLVICFLFCAITILFPPNGNRTRENRYRSDCQLNLKQIALACLLYARDSNSRLMPISNDQGQGWADLLAPYAKTRSFFQCPKGTAPPTENRSDYFYNARLANYELKNISLPMQVIMGGEGYDNGGTNSNLRAIPQKWLTDEDSPAHRHLSFGNYVFADGHVKSMHPASISNSDHYLYGERPFGFALN